ncbi:hypothetical protein [Dehalogenimonas etheniformans]|nr:hypothetical protein [Dehalogenimonas etheniformans]QNT75913.1 hypothetical protein HX448_04025 [Dehalogenimonas etheniformans]
MPQDENMVSELGAGILKIQDKEIRKAVHKAVHSLFRQIESEPTIVGVAFDGKHGAEEQAGTLTEVGAWLFHRRQEDEHSGDLSGDPGST